VSFAIPVDTAVDVMRQLRAHGRVMRPYVGIKMLQLTKHNAASFRRRDAAFPAVDAGILVPGVHGGSPAERAGLRAGDVIVGACRPLASVSDKPRDAGRSAVPPC
jgi:HtrA serine peptidase 2